MVPGTGEHTPGQYLNTKQCQPAYKPLVLTGAVCGSCWSLTAPGPSFSPLVTPPICVLGAVRVRLTGDLALSVDNEGLTAGLSPHKLRTGLLPALPCQHSSPTEYFVALALSCGGTDWRAGGTVAVIGTAPGTFRPGSETVGSAVKLPHLSHCQLCPPRRTPSPSTPGRNIIQLSSPGRTRTHSIGGQRTETFPG